MRHLKRRPSHPSSQALPHSLFACFKLASCSVDFTLTKQWGRCQNFLLWIHVLMNRTRAAFELKMQKANKTTDLRIPASVCTMFNVLVDAKKQSTKLCALDGGQEVSGLSVTCGRVAQVPWQRTMLFPKSIHLIRLKKPSSPI